MYKRLKHKLKNNIKIITQYFNSKNKSIIEIHNKKRHLLIQSKTQITEKTKKLLSLHDNTVHQKYTTLVENFSIYSIGLKKKLKNLNSVLKLVNESNIRIKNPFDKSSSYNLNFWDIQDLEDKVKNKIQFFRLFDKSDKQLNSTKIKSHMEELSNYYKEYQLVQQKRVFRKRILKFYDNNIKIFCRMINSKDFEKALQLKSRKP